MANINNQVEILEDDEYLILNAKEEWESIDGNNLPDYNEDFLLGTPNEASTPIPEVKTNDIRSTDCFSFKDLLLKAEIIKSLTTGGYEHPTEVQSECIPQALLGVDILAQAQSGTGKTVAFILSTLNLLEFKENNVQTLVICPTRELAHQIGKQYEQFSKYLSGVKVATFFGGLPIKCDVDTLRNNCPHVVVGTVGRILSLMKSKMLDVQHIKHFVLDECDQMLLLLNTRKQIQEIYFNLPREKQVLMFSATLDQEIRTVCKKFMRNPIEIGSDEKGGIRMSGLVQNYVCLNQSSKFKKLVEVLGSIQYTQAVIFVNSVKRCKIVENLLIKNQYSAIGIHRMMSQKDRLMRYEEVKTGKKKILVATNIFGRGMDVGGINTVINYDVPADADSYLHGVARAGRFDTVGTAITFVASDEDAKLLTEVQKKFHIKITKLSA